MSEQKRNSANGEFSAELVGNLRTDLQLILQTRQAQVLVRGRTVVGKPVIIGLVGFSDRLRLIWQAAEEDDPYADWWLIKIHEGLSVAEARIEKEMSQMQTILKSTRSLKIAPSEVKEPFRMVLQFASPYAYRAARILGEFDELACYAYTAKQIGLIDINQCQLALRSTARRIRSVFNMPMRYRRLGLVRGAALRERPEFKRAEDLMGVLPQDVLEAKRRAPLSPTIRGESARDIPPVVSESIDDVVFD